MNDLPFKTYGNPPKTLVNACLKYADKIEWVSNEGDDGYWIVCRAGFWSKDNECLSIHERTVKDCLWQLPRIEPDPRPEDKR